MARYEVRLARHNTTRHAHLTPLIEIMKNSSDNNVHNLVRRGGRRIEEAVFIDIENVKNSSDKKPS